MRCHREPVEYSFAIAARPSTPRRRFTQVCRAAATETCTKQEGVEKRQVVSYNGVNFLVDDNPDLKSSWGQRLTVASSSLAMSLLLANGVSHGIDAPQAILCAFCGFVFADLGSGLYHFGVDNYGDKDTPLFGSQIAAFQAGLTSSQWDIFAATAIFFIAMSQQFHAWSHMRPSQLPAAVIALQDANVIISRKAHGTHHRSPFNVNYCIVSGWCNPLLDSGVMLALEKGIQRLCGVQPRGWSEPQAGWRELTPDEAAAADRAPPP